MSDTAIRQFGGLAGQSLADEKFRRRIIGRLTALFVVVAEFAIRHVASALFRQQQPGTQQSAASIRREANGTDDVGAVPTTSAHSAG